MFKLSKGFSRKIKVKMVVIISREKLVSPFLESPVVAVVLGESLDSQMQTLNSKIQSLSNWAEILDSMSLETTYGLLLANRGRDSKELWDLFLIDLSEIRQIFVNLKSGPEADSLCE